MNSTQLLLLGLLVWFAMSNKSKDTRNVVLVVTGILFFCMMNVKEGFVIEADTLSAAADATNAVRITAGSEAGPAEGHIFTINNRSGLDDVAATAAALSANNNQPVGPEVTCEIPGGGGVAEAKWAAAAADFEDSADIDATNIHRLFVCSPCIAGQTVTDGVCTGAGSGRPLTCPAGTYLPEAPATECIECAANTFKAGTGTGPCTDCPEEKTSPPRSVSAAACTAANQGCPAGKYAATGGVCTDCAANTFKATVGDGPCTPCPTGKTSSGGATVCTTGGGGEPTSQGCPDRKACDETCWFGCNDDGVANVGENVGRWCKRGLWDTHCAA